MLWLPFIGFSGITGIVFLLLINKNIYPGRFFYLLLGFYLISVWWLIYHPNETFGTPNYYMPHFYYHHAKIVYWFSGWLDPSTFLNLVMTIPAGAFITYFFKKHIQIGWIIVLAILIGLFNESSQFIFDNLLNLQRTVDIMDVTTNALGVIIGYVIMKYGIDLTVDDFQTL